MRKVFALSSIAPFLRRTADKYLLPIVPDRIRDNFRQLSAGAERDLREAEREFRNVASLNEKQYKDLLLGRLSEFRRFIVPWIGSVCSFEKCSVLEIGTGTGCSTVALAEQGARVTGIDLSMRSVELAKRYLLAYDLSADLKAMNACDIGNLNGPFDMVVFWASLEHMSYSERLISLAKAWELLRRGGYLTVVECPNRLWYMDSHTSMLPFFLWLPDEIAVAYAKHSPRARYGAELKDMPDQFARWGRGASYHEFELAIGRYVSELVVSSLGEYLGRNMLRSFLRSWTTEYKYMRILGKQDGPRHVGWREATLNLIIQKPAHEGGSIGAPKS